jgi:hypothetical protein
MRMLPGIIAAWFVLSASFSATRAADAEVSSPSRYEQPKLRTATIYEAKSNQTNILYKFRRTVIRSGPTVKVEREFTDPDGKVAVRDRIEYEGNDLVSYEIEELQINARGTVRVKPASKNQAKGKVAFTYITSTSSTTRTNHNIESLAQNTLVGDMVGPFMAAHWNELIKGRTVKCRYIVPSRAETVGFEFKKHAESNRQGKPVVIIKMAPSSYLIAALVDPLFFTVEKDGDHRVLQYDGRTDPKLKVGGKWKDLDAVIVFDLD